MIGDTRVNANPYVTTLYTTFLRSHNILAKRLHKKNVADTDNFIYEKAKKLNRFIYQKIIYEEWAKIILGNDVTNRINNEAFPGIRKLSDKRVSNEFATAAIRFYYSMIPGDLHVNENNMLLPTQSNLINSLRYDIIFFYYIYNYYNNKFICIYSFNDIKLINSLSYYTHAWRDQYIHIYNIYKQ